MSPKESVDRIARNPDVSREERLRAIDLLEDDDAKADIALSDFDPEIAVYAADRIKRDQVRIRLAKAPISEVRMRAICAIEQTKYLFFFEDDPHPQNRRMVEHRQRRGT